MAGEQISQHDERTECGRGSKKESLSGGNPETLLPRSFSSDLVLDDFLGRRPSGSPRVRLTCLLLCSSPITFDIFSFGYNEHKKQAIVPEFWAQQPACLHASVSLTSSCSPLFSFWLRERALRRCPTSSAPLSWHICLVRKRGTPPKPRISSRKIHNKGLCLFLDWKKSKQKNMSHARDLQ